MWSYGMLALNVFTNHFLKRRIPLKMKSWHKDIYPLLYEAMQVRIIIVSLYILYNCLVSDYVIPSQKWYYLQSFDSQRISEQQPHKVTKRKIALALFQIEKRQERLFYFMSKNAKQRDRACLILCLKSPSSAIQHALFFVENYQATQQSMPYFMSKSTKQRDKACFNLP